MLNENHVTETVISNHKNTSTLSKGGVIPAVLDKSGRGSAVNYMLCDPPICGIPAIPFSILFLLHPWLWRPVIFLQNAKIRFQEQLYKMSKIFKH